MRKKLLIKSNAVVWNKQTVIQTIIDKEMVSNKETIADIQGEYDDWIDLYTIGNRFVNIDSYFFYDDALYLQKHQLLNFDSTITNISAKGFVLFWTEEEWSLQKDHFVFKIPNGNTIFLLDAIDANLSSISPLNLSSDQSYDLLQKEETNKQLLTQTFSPLSRNTNSSTAEVFISEQAQSFTNNIFIELNTDNTIEVGNLESLKTCSQSKLPISISEVEKLHFSIPNYLIIKYSVVSGLALKVSFCYRTLCRIESREARIEMNPV